MLQKATLPAAIALVLFCAFVVAKLAAALELESTFQMAGFSLLPFVSKVEAFLQQQLAKRGLSDPPSTVVPFGRYATAPGRMFVYGTLFIVGVVSAGAFLAGLTAAFVGAGAQVSPETLQAVVGVVAYLFLPVAILALGTWIGLRVVRYAVPTLIACSLASRYMLALIDFALLDGDQFEQLFGMSKADAVVAVLVYGSLHSLTFALTLGLLGIWLGRKQRVAHYVASLIRQVPPSTRSALVDAVHREAVRSHDQASSVRSGASEYSPLQSSMSQGGLWSPP